MGRSSPPLVAGSVLIVNYHAIAPGRSPVSSTAQELESDLRGLRDAGFQFVTLDECAEWLAGSGSIPARSAAITFDDGYASVASEALPILADRSVPCTVFVIAGRLGRDNAWPGQWASVPRLPLIDRAALTRLVDAGVCIAAHTESHPVLTELTAEAARREVVDAGDALEDLIGRPVRHFAYPYGRRGQREMDLARQRYRLALGAAPGSVGPSADPYDVPRLDAHDVRFALKLHLTAPDWRLEPYLAARRVMRQFRRSLGG